MTIFRMPAAHPDAPGYKPPRQIGVERAPDPLAAWDAATLRERPDAVTDKRGRPMRWH
jgi:uncharacterized membrane protein